MRIRRSSRASRTAISGERRDPAGERRMTLPGPRVGPLPREKPRFARPRQDAVGKRPREHPGEERQHVDPHVRASLTTPRAGRRPPAAPPCRPCGGRPPPREGTRPPLPADGRPASRGPLPAPHPPPCPPRGPPLVHNEAPDRVRPVELVLGEGRQLFAPHGCDGLHEVFRRLEGVDPQQSENGAAARTLRRHHFVVTDRPGRRPSTPGEPQRPRRQDPLGIPRERRHLDLAADPVEADDSADVEEIDLPAQAAGVFGLLVSRNFFHAPDFFSRLLTVSVGWAPFASPLRVTASSITIFARFSRGAYVPTEAAQRRPP